MKVLIIFEAFEVLEFIDFAQFLCYQ